MGIIFLDEAYCWSSSSFFTKISKMQLSEKNLETQGSL